MEESSLRKPAVAGQFYPSSKTELKKILGELTSPNLEKQDAIACVLPHAGYIYSGKVAGQTVSRINIKDKVILLGPNHTGYGTEFSIMSAGAWRTPLGDIKIDSSLAKKIQERSSDLQDDALAHMHEHSLEVELPFLQFFKPDFEIVPIAFATGNIYALKQIGRQIASVILEEKLKSSCLIVASSDMTHYEPQEEAEKKDHEAIKAMLELNEDRLIEEIRKYNITMCGFAPVVCALAAAKDLGAKNAKLALYQTSGDVSGDKSSVVGYAGIIIY
ncbi:MAG: AmmeMemoRadiSam system protein B [Candidatus Omnitrophica bacterium]|nr:AmmeMemoRadiSam system protein B [Candidatus Omnitrophota bacterium]